MTLRLLGAGSYLPHTVVSNDELAKQLKHSGVETSDEWIFTRTGISQRHIASEEETSAFMASKSALQALSKAQLTPRDIDMIIVASTTPDRTFPSIACDLQARLGCAGIPAFDLQAVCTGFIYALSTASCFINSGPYKRIMLVGVEKMSKIIDWIDRGTCILFGDGAGAVIVEKDQRNFQDSLIRSDGSFSDILYTSGGGAFNNLPNYIKMQGSEVFKHAVHKMIEVSHEILKINNLDINQIDYLVPHQANIRIIDAITQKIGIADSKVIKTIQHHANCSAASIPLALDYLFTTNPKGLIMTLGFGAGLTWGANLLYV